MSSIIWTLTVIPSMFPDWTHSNAVVYSKDDGNILVSVRHQNWVLKVNYADGVGDGSILWRLGQGGDFTMIGGTDPTDWAYAQHFPAFFSPNTSGVFSLGVMDNGDDRAFPSGVSCGKPGVPACLYTTIPVYQIDEGCENGYFNVPSEVADQSLQFLGRKCRSARKWQRGVRPFRGRKRIVCVRGNSEGTPQTVWNMHISGTSAYRAFASQVYIQVCNGKGIETLGHYRTSQAKYKCGDFLCISPPPVA